MAGGLELDGLQGPFQPKPFYVSVSAAPALSVLPFLLEVLAVIDSCHK